MKATEVTEPGYYWWRDCSEAPTWRLVLIDGDMMGLYGDVEGPIDPPSHGPYMLIERDADESQ